jgi:hypothetical protein
MKLEGRGYLHAFPPSKDAGGNDQLQPEFGNDLIFSLDAVNFQLIG